MRRVTGDGLGAAEAGPAGIRTNRLVIRAMTLFAGVAAAIPSAPLWAQSITNAPPAESFQTSPGGVDMRSGRFVYSHTDLVIGGDDGLSLTRSLAQQVRGHANPFGNLSHNWDILLSEKKVNFETGDFSATANGPDYQIEVSFGGLSQTFRNSLNGFYQVSRSGFAQLTWTGSSDRSQSNIVYTFQAADGTVATFHAIGTLASAECSNLLRCAYVSQVTRPDGTILSFDYDTTGGAHAARLRTVTSSRGYALMFEYGSGLVSKACVLNLGLQVVPANHLCPTSAQATASYAYTTNGGASVLASVTDPGGAVWSFSYGVGTMSFFNPNETTPWLINHYYDRMDDDGLVSQIINSQNFADGSSYSYGFTESPFVVGHIPSIAGGSYTDAQNHSVTVAYDFPIVPHPPVGGHGTLPIDGGDGNVYQITTGPVAITDQLGRTTTFDYCDPTTAASLPLAAFNRCLVAPMLISGTDPMGIKTVYTNDYNARNVLGRTQIAAPGSTQPNGQPWPNITTSATFNCTPATFRYCAKPVSVTDARNNTTNYDYSADHGGLLAETGPEVNGVHPQTRHAYAQRQAWITNGSGYVAAGPPIWVPTSISLCRTSAPTGNPAAPCATTGDEVLTQFEYGRDSGPNTLLLRGQSVTSTNGGSTTTLRTCYTYDALGRKISETQPNGTASLTSCP
jgi:YD repeat-containing protein